MKITTLIATLIWCSCSIAQPFHGYIVKLNTPDKSYSPSSFQWIQNLNQVSNLKLKKEQTIEYIEPNYIYSKFTDEKFSYQWALENRGLNSGDWNRPGVVGEDIEILPAWELTTGSKDLIIAIIDTGIDLSHPDLKDNLWANEQEMNGRANNDDDHNGIIDDIHGANFITNSGNIQDGDGHGTHCAGIIGAKHNQVGVRGVLNQVKLMPLKFLDDQGNGDTLNAVKAIYYAVDHGATIISNSWGGGARSEALYEAIQYAQSKGVLFIAAAGNSNNDNDKNPIYPASYDLDNIVAVAASSPYGRKSQTSNYGVESVDLFAPGESILSTFTGSTYKRQSGTSMAAPFVAGVLGLMQSIHPHSDYLTLKQTLIQSTDESIHYKIFTHSSGRLNSFSAVKQSL